MDTYEWISPWILKKWSIVLTISNVRAMDGIMNCVDYKFTLSAKSIFLQSLVFQMLTHTFLFDTWIIWTLSTPLVSSHNLVERLIITLVRHLRQMMALSWIENFQHGLHHSCIFPKHFEIFSSHPTPFLHLFWNTFYLGLERPAQLTSGWF